MIRNVKGNSRLESRRRLMEGFTKDTQKFGKLVATVVLQDGEFHSLNSINDRAYNLVSIDSRVKDDITYLYMRLYDHDPIILPEDVKDISLQMNSMLSDISLMNKAYPDKIKLATMSSFR